MTVLSMRRTAQVLQLLVLALAPAGGQTAARRNAWASMSQGSARARGRREADLAMDRALARAERSAAAR